MGSGVLRYRGGSGHVGPRSYGGTMGRGGAPPGEMVDTVTVGCGAGVNSLTNFE